MVCPVDIPAGSSAGTLGSTRKTTFLVRCEVAFACEVTCYHPLQAWRSRYGGRLTFDRNKAINAADPVEVPCGQCVGCRIARAREWQLRMVHEAKLHAENSFLTLTYDDDHMPSDGSVSVSACQKFLKRLRFQVSLHRGEGGGGSQLRYYYCGEYGEQRGRPHYHFVIFGWFPHDARRWRVVRGNTSYRSEFLEKVWPFGNAEVGRVTPESAGYVARYSMKKVNGDGAIARAHYVRPHPVTGELYQVLPEFGRMSRKPGIGSGWFDRFYVDCFPSDYLVLKGQKRPVPAYYTAKLARLDPLLHEAIKEDRWVNANTPEVLAEKTPERLRVRERLQTLRAQLLIRPVE